MDQQKSPRAMILDRFAAGYINIDTLSIEEAADSVRVTEQPKSMAWGWQYNVTLTPLGDTAPWRIDYSYRVELLSSDAAKQGILPLPARPARTTSQSGSLVPLP